MTFAQLFDTLVRDSGDPGGSYRSSLMTWLNMVRATAARGGTWRSAIDGDATITTSAANTTGIYELTGYEQVIGDLMFDRTQNYPVQHDSEQSMLSFDPNRDDFGPPIRWCDAGATPAGNRNIRFYPIPNDVRTIGFVGYKVLSDVSSEALSIDPFFGPIIDKSPMFQAGLRYYLDLSSNEDATQIAIQKNVFNKTVKDALSDDRVDPQGSVRLDPVGRRMVSVVLGRLDPGHYSNR